MSLSARNWAWDLDARSRQPEDDPGSEPMVPLKPGEKLTLLCIAEFENVEHGYSFPSHETLAARTGQSLRTIHTHVKALAAFGMLEVQRRRSNDGEWLRHVYVLNVPEQFRDDDKQWMRHHG